MIRLLISSCICFLLAGPVSADDLQLKTMIRTNYPENVMTTRYSLAKYILAGTDYRIYMGKNAPDDVQSIMLRTDIPTYKKEVLVNRVDALLMASGKNTLILIDEKNKLISFTETYHNE